MSSNDAKPASSASVRRGSIRGLLASFSGQGLCLLIACGQIAIISRLLPPEMFGVFGMTWAVLSLLYNIKDLGLSTAVVQSLREDQAFLDSAFWLSVLGGAGLALCVAALGPLMAWIYGQPSVAEACYKLAPMFAIGGITSHYQAIMRRRMQFVRLNAITVVAQVVGTGGAILFAIYGYGIDALVFQTLGQELTCLVLLPIICDWRPKSLHMRADAYELITFGGNLSVFRLVQNLASTMDHVSLGLFTNPAIVGLYNRAQTLLSTPRRQLVLPLSQVMPTLLSKLQNHEESFANASANIISASSYVWYGFLAAVIAIPVPILNLVLGSQWDGAALIMQFLAIGEMARMPLMMINMAETQLGNTRSLRNFGLLSAPLTAGGLMLGAYLGGTTNGALYMAVSYAILQIVLLILRMYQIGNDTPLTPKLLARALRGPIALGAALTMCFHYGAMPFADKSPFLQLCGAGAAGIAFAGAILIVSKRARDIVSAIIRDIRGAMRRRS